MQVSCPHAVQDSHKTGATEIQYLLVVGQLSMTRTACGRLHQLRFIVCSDTFAEPQVTSKNSIREMEGRAESRPVRGSSGTY